MINTMNQSPRFIIISSSVLRYGVIFLLAALTNAAQSRIVTPTQQTNSNSGRQQHVTTLHSRDSQEGSRVAISSDQSLSNYEAYRRGDHFYVKIPAANVPRPEAVRGRGFADVKAQRNGNSTVLSFRLQPGATAHVEQRANKLDVVVTVPGGSTATTQPARTRESARSNVVDPMRSAQPNQRTVAPKTANKNEVSRTNPASVVPGDLNSNKKSGASTSASSKATPTPAQTPSPKSSPTPKAAASASAPKAAVTKPSPTAAPVTQTTQPRQDFWSRMKERAHYWILLAQLNPIPVAVGAGLLLLIIGLLLLQRRRAKGTRRVKPAKAEPAKTTSKPVVEVSAPAVEPEPAVDAVIPAAASVAAASIALDEPVASTTPVVAAVPSASPVDDPRRERVNRVADEAKKLFEGAEYDEAILGSDDRDTRRLVGAELLSALVGRNPERRERARAAFMKHGYFDDATRDLRIANSDNERAAAARRLSFVHDREATPHLIGALSDPSPDVRRASVEALMDLRDPSAIGPLNSLMQSENDRKVPRNLLKHAIEACATSAPEQTSTSMAVDASEALSHPVPQSIETEREVIEI